MVYGLSGMNRINATIVTASNINGAAMIAIALHSSMIQLKLIARQI
jgi:hypothetical protein